MLEYSTRPPPRLPTSGWAVSAAISSVFGCPWAAAGFYDSAFARGAMRSTTEAPYSYLVNVAAAALCLSAVAVFSTRPSKQPLRGRRAAIVAFGLSFEWCLLLAYVLIAYGTEYRFR